MNMKPFQTIAICAALGLLASISQAAEPAGYVKTVGGEATVTSAGKTVAATAGAPLVAGDVIKTGPGGSLGVTLRDNTLMSFGPSTSFTLEDYLFAPAKGDLKLGGKIAAGTLHYVSGSIAHLKPDAVAIKTPTGIIGVRGTRFVVVVEE
jgi:hypothetical protein